MFFRPPEAPHMNEALDQVSRRDTPQHVLQLAPRDFGKCVCQTAEGGGVEKRKSGSRQEKDEEDFRHDRRVINHKILQALFVDLPALSMEGTKAMDGLVIRIGIVCVDVCVFSSLFLLRLHYCPIPYSFCRCWLWSCTISPSGRYILDRYRERKALAGSKSVTALTKTCQR